MESEKRKKDSREEELDRFWDIDALIPRKRTVPPAVDTDTVELELHDKGNAPSAPKDSALPPRKEPVRHFIPPHTADSERTPSPDEEYAPDHALLRRVRIYRWKSNYRYYEDFLRDATRLYPIRGEECPRVPFFSYVPQYGQMSRPQLEWYLWWRQRMRQGEYLETDYSYLLLYAYEMINLAGKVDPTVARDALANLWAQYRATFHQLDSYLPEWICDLCLIHRLPPPVWEDKKLQAAAMEHCRLREFYVACGREEGYVHALLAFCSNYDYRKSKFCTKENQPHFDRAVTVVLQYVMQQTGEDGKLFSKAELEDSKMMRDAYTGALCAFRNKRKMEVEYCSFSRSHEIRYLVTDLIKYTENRLRAVLGIRSRLTVYALPNSIRAMADAVLEPLLPSMRGEGLQKKNAPAPYEKLYDLPRQKLSLAAAEEIERASWQTTRRLVEAFEEEPMEEIVTEEQPPVPVVQAEVVAEEASQEEESAFFPYLDFLWAALEEDPRRQKAFATAYGKPADVIADEINELAADLLGDILLEPDGIAYTVLEDYRDMAEEMVRQDGKGIE